MLKKGDELLKHAMFGGYAVGAFNCVNFETALSIVKAGEELKKPIILQTTEGALKYGEGFLESIANMVASKADVDIVLHLDHGTNFETVKKCIEFGYTSIMIDGSALSFEENVNLTKDVAIYAHSHGVSVEGELGRLGGKEDDMSVDPSDARYTDPDMALEFVKLTKVDSLAVAVGTAHGPYNEVPVLDVERLHEIFRKLQIPIVLHGASGLSADQIKSCVRAGACKINIDTDLKTAFTRGLKEIVEDNPIEYDVRKIFKTASKNMSEVVKQKINIFHNDHEKGEILRHRFDEYEEPPNS